MFFETLAYWIFQYLVYYLVDIAYTRRQLEQASNDDERETIWRRMSFGTTTVGLLLSVIYRTPKLLLGLSLFTFALSFRSSAGRIWQRVPSKTRRTTGDVLRAGTNAVANALLRALSAVVNRTLPTTTEKPPLTEEQSQPTGLPHPKESYLKDFGRQPADPPFMSPLLSPGQYKYKTSTPKDH